jgi:hypothetical protein
LVFCWLRRSFYCKAAPTLNAFDADSAMAVRVHPPVLLANSIFQKLA